jgi:hypothetical protein
MVKIEQSVVYPEVWFIKLDKATIQITKEEVLDIIDEARRLNKELN